MSAKSRGCPGRSAARSLKRVHARLRRAMAKWCTADPGPPHALFGMAMPLTDHCRSDILLCLAHFIASIRISHAEGGCGPMRWKPRPPGFIPGLPLVIVGCLPADLAFAQNGTDWVTKFARDPVHVTSWPAGKKVAVSFALFVEVFGFGQGPVLRPDL